MDFYEIFFSTFKRYFENSVYHLTHPTITTSYYWVALWCLVCFLLEYFLPKKLKYPLNKRKGFWLDLFYVIFYDVLFMALGFYAILVVFENIFINLLHSIGINSIVLVNIHSLPVIFQLLILFLLHDFFEYLSHYLLHRVNFLWAFHKIHHAPKEIGFATSRHFHWGEYFVFKTLLYIPFHVVGFSTKEYSFVVLTIFIFDAFFTHCNIKTNFKFFNYIINNPETHFWHHAKNIPTKYGVNYASVLNIWDVLFGTYYLPSDNEKPELGLEDSNEIPETFFGQMFYPFVYLFKKNKKYTRASRRMLKRKSAKTATFK